MAASDAQKTHKRPRERGEGWPNGLQGKSVYAGKIGERRRSSQIENLLDKLGVTGSSPVPPIRKALHKGFFVARQGDTRRGCGKDWTPVGSSERLVSCSLTALERTGPND